MARHFKFNAQEKQADGTFKSVATLMTRAEVLKAIRNKQNLPAEMAAVANDWQVVDWGYQKGTEKSKLAELLFRVKAGVKVTDAHRAVAKAFVAGHKALEDALQVRSYRTYKDHRTAWGMVYDALADMAQIEDESERVGRFTDVMELLAMAGAPAPVPTQGYPGVEEEEVVAQTLAKATPKVASKPKAAKKAAPVVTPPPVAPAVPTDPATPKTDTVVAQTEVTA